MPNVESTAISRIRYDERSRGLYVTFKDSGHTYRYDGVPQPVYLEFMSASSKGVYFNAHIKDRYAFVLTRRH
jgi:predicted HAD superfamily hydrolase